MTMISQKPSYTFFTSEVVKSLIRAAGDAIEEGRCDEIEAIGMPVTLVKSLASLNTTEQSNLLRLSRRMTWPVNWDHLEKLIQFARSDSKKTQQLNMLIQAQATWPLLHSLFGISELEFAQRRRLFGLPKSSGRPRAPTEAEEQRIYTVWQKTKGKPLVERLLLSHQQTQLSVSSICCCLKPELRDITNKGAVS